MTPTLHVIIEEIHKLTERTDLPEEELKKRIKLIKVFCETQK